MTERLFCYTCRAYHPSAQMMRFHTRGGLRWRCRRSVEAAKCSVAERDTFGEQQTGINIDTAKQIASRPFIPLLARRIQR